jgi:hypothetical protein
MSTSVLRRSTAVGLVFGLLSLTSSGMVRASSPSTLSGRVVWQNGADPRAGVVVTLIEPTSERAYRSSPTDAQGTFTIDAAPAGKYELVVEAPEGAFLAASNLDLAPGLNRPLSLALRPGKQDQPPPATPPPATPPPATPPPATPPPAEAQKKEGLPTWAKWVIAGGIIVGGAIVIDAVSSSDNNNASPF